MTRGRPALVAALALASCVVETDVVASLPAIEDAGKGPLLDDAGPQPPPDAELDAGKPKDASTFADGASNFNSHCAEGAQHLFLIEESGALTRVLAETLQVEPLGTPDCLTRGVIAAALDRSGMLWVSLKDQSLWLVEPTSGSCKPLELKAKVGALTFVFDSTDDSEWLYFVDAGITLMKLDPIGLEQTAVGEIKTAYLVGNGRGEDLLALDELGEDALALGAVGLDDAVVTPLWTIGRTFSQSLHGATGWRGDIALLLGTELNTYRPGLDLPQKYWLRPEVPGTLVALASSICGASGK
jgi:hypothetical protein